MGAGLVKFQASSFWQGGIFFTKSTLPAANNLVAY